MRSVEKKKGAAKIITTLATACVLIAMPRQDIRRLLYFRQGFKTPMRNFAARQSDTIPNGVRNFAATAIGRMNFREQSLY